MYKSLFYRELLLLAIVTLGIPMTAQQTLIHSGDRTLNINEAVDQGLYEYALQHYDPYTDIQLQEKRQLVSLINTRYPELISAIEDADRYVLADTEIATILLEVVKEESSQGLIGTDDALVESIEKDQLSSQDLATLEFLYGYELFRSKRLVEADKIWQRILKKRKGEYEYAAYYAGLTAILQERYYDAVSHLTIVGKTEKLLPHIPYYLSVAHFASEDYHAVIKYYGLRLDESNLHNIEGITKLVAYSYFKTEKYKECVDAMNKLSYRKELTTDEAYILSMALQKSGNTLESQEILAAVANMEGNAKNAAAYQYALQLAEQKDYAKAISEFEKFIGDRDYNQEDVMFNLAALHGNNGNIDELVNYSIQLQNTKHEQASNQMLASVIDNIDNPSTYQMLISTLRRDASTHDALKKSLYSKGLAALQQKDFTTTNHYFKLLEKVDPLIEERGAVSAWKGIMAFHDKNYTTSRELLTKYLGSRPKGQGPSNLEFDAYYFLAYSNFKLQQHKQALGNYAKALSLLSSNRSVVAANDRKDTEEDLHLRIADNYFLLDDYTKAYTSYDKVTEISGSHRDYALWQKAVIAELKNDPYDQILLLDDLISTHRDSRYYNRALFSTANTLFSLNKYDKAANFYQRIINDDVPQRMKEESVVQMGLIAVNAGEYDRATEYYNEIIASSKDPEITHRAQLALKEIYSDYTYDTDAYLDLVEKTEPETSTEELDRVLWDLANNTAEIGSIDKAIDQWKKLTIDFPESGFVDDAYLKIAEAYQNQEKWDESIAAYQDVIASKESTHHEVATDQLLSISFHNLKDYKLFQEIYEELTGRNEKYIAQYTTSLIENKEIDKAAMILPSLFASSTVSNKSRKATLNKLTEQLMLEKKWNQITEISGTPSIAKMIDESPKHIYFRALAYMNLGNLDTSIVSVTDHYEKLLDDPAWLAKSIILLSDVYVLQKDLDSAEAALTALIETDSKVPPSLITVAKNRLENLIHVAN